MGCCGSCGGEGSTPPKEQENDQIKDQEQNSEQEQTEVRAQDQE